MSVPFNPTTLLDCYKFGHRLQYPEGTTRVYSNMTPRGSRVPGINSVLFFGFQAFLDDLIDAWEEGFFQQPEEHVVRLYQRRIDGMLGPNNVGVEHIRALHRLGYLPLEFRALPEGIEVPLRIPVWTVENTLPEFFWLVNYIETYASTETWLPTTSATTALHLRRLLNKWADLTSDTPEFVDFQAHDFSYRGMATTEAAAKSGAGHLLSFAGTDTVPALDWIEYHYATGNSVLGVSVAATEHSVMCAGGQEDEQGTFKRLLDLYPSGIVSVVSDTWDLWAVLNEILPSLKDEILGRDGKLVIRPDSGDPADIICGTMRPALDSNGVNQFTIMWDERTNEQKGVIELLWDIFGGTVNEKGYKVLDPHVGVIYGDSITYDRANEICRRLEAKGFASTNVVFGIGSFTYQYVTRDTFGFAMKATWAEVNGEGRNLFKDPVTDSGLKRSARGRLAVIEVGGELTLIEEATEEIENSPDNLLKVVFRDGTIMNAPTWTQIVDRVGKRFLK